MSAITEINFTEMPGHGGQLGVITLQRPEALNALNLVMLKALCQKLAEWASNNTVKAVVIHAVPGRAFCAGGDLREIWQMKQVRNPQLIDVFHQEYQLNHQIFYFPKPYIALLNGLTMGGGAGISIHGSHRIVTETMSLAMPETGIGFFPDIRASYFLSRLPYKTGLYMGLSGEHITSADCLALELADTLIDADTEFALIERLAAATLPNHDAVTSVIQSFALPTPPSPLSAHQSTIQRCFSKNTVEEIIAALNNEKNEWSQKTAALIETRSPTSLKVTLRELQQGEHLDFDACGRMEEPLMRQFLESHDFFEGIRAALIDKDHRPQWQPAALEEVSEARVEEYFKRKSTKVHKISVNRNP